MLTVFPWGYLAFIAAFATAVLVAQAFLGRANHVPEGARVVAIDGLRGYLALGVLCHHFLTASNFAMTGTWKAPENVFFANLGPVAVQIFFFITAFLFYSRARKTVFWRDWLALYVNRLFRLAPLYLLVALLLIVVAFSRDGWHFTAPFSDNAIAIIRWLSLGLLGAGDINGNPLTFTIVAGVTWTLRYEWLFYFSLPLVGIFCLVPYRALRIAALVAMFAAATVLPPVSLPGFTTAILSAFLLGMLAEELSHMRISAVLKSPLAAVIGLSGLSVAMFSPLDGFHPVQLCGSALFFLPAVCGNSYFRILERRTSRWLGDISYSIYLVHGLVIYVTTQSLHALGLYPFGTATWLVMPLLAAIVVCFSRLTFLTVELPFLTYGKSVSSRLRAMRGPRHARPEHEGVPYLPSTRPKS